MSISALQTEWIQLYDELDKAFPGDALAAPFLSAQDATEGAQKRQILLVGKATAEGWGKEPFDLMKNEPLMERLEERRRFTSEHLEFRRNRDRNPPAFWRCWHRLGLISPPVMPVIWTNLAKIGVDSGNPSQRLIERQSALAQRTLWAEMEEYKPALVVLVTNKFAADEIAHPVFGDRDSWEQPTDSMWFKRATQTDPAMLWVDHPQMKRKDEVDLWLKVAQELIS